MKKPILVAMLALASSVYAGESKTPLGTNSDVQQIKQSSTCQKSGETKEQCNFKKPEWSIKPASQHVIVNNNTYVGIEAMMFKKEQFNSVSKLLVNKWGKGSEDITKTSVSWKVENWLYTLSKNPNGEVALIGVKN